MFFFFYFYQLLQLAEQFEDVAEYSVTDDIQQPGQVIICLIAGNGSTTKKSLKEISRHHPVGTVQQMGHVYQQMKDIYNESKSVLATLELKSNTLFQRTADDLRYGPSSLRSDVRAYALFKYVKLVMIY